MAYVIQAELKSIFVKFNGDIEATEKLRKKRQKLASLQDKYDELLSSMDDSEIHADDLESFNATSRRIQELKSTINNHLIVDLKHVGESGSETVMREVELGNGSDAGIHNVQRDFLRNGLFRKVVYGDFALGASVSDTDEANPFGVFFRRVFAGAFKTVVGGPIGGVSNVIVASAATELSADIQTAIKGSDEDRVAAIARSKVAHLAVEEGELELLNPDQGISLTNNILELKFSVPGVMRTAPNRIAKVGAKNGRVQFWVDVRPT